VTKVDFTDVQGFEALPDGEYTISLSKYEIIEESKASGKPFVKMEFEVNSHPGRLLWCNYSLQTTAKKYLLNALIAMGADVDKISSGSFDIEEVLEELVSSDVIAVVGTREYQGEARNEIIKLKTSWG